MLLTIESARMCGAVVVHIEDDSRLLLGDGWVGRLTRRSAASCSARASLVAFSVATWSLAALSSAIFRSRQVFLCAFWQERLQYATALQLLQVLRGWAEVSMVLQLAQVLVAIMMSLGMVDGCKIFGLFRGDI